MHFRLLFLSLAATAFGFPSTTSYPELSPFQANDVRDKGTNDLHARCERGAEYFRGVKNPDTGPLWEAMEKANVSLGLQVDLQSIIWGYARDVVNQTHEAGGPSNGINNTAMNYLERMTYSGLYNNFTTEFMESIVHLQILAAKDIRSINITRQFLENWEFKEKDGLSGLDQLSLQANDVIAWLNKIIIEQIDRIHRVRQIFEDAIKANPSIGGFEYEYSFFGVKMDLESDWLVDYDYLSLYTKEEKQALIDNRERYDALIRSGLDKINPSLFEEKLMKVVSNYTLGANMT